MLSWNNYNATGRSTFCLLFILYDCTKISLYHKWAWRCRCLTSFNPLKPVGNIFRKKLFPIRLSNIKTTTFREGYYGNVLPFKCASSRRFEWHNDKVSKLLRAWSNDCWKTIPYIPIGKTHFLGANFVALTLITPHETGK